ncbi:hypothetical protein [Nocardia sp. 852002-51244_SCH5132740]|uniref:hypothetical protein n=1 Tax=Nocardia sp. 852002-51244_SCH5132740 TaxID=1834099 RepID=UPI0007EC04CA|nr:hypothetical protein [Nocardia sp. 852002-51244_SCH5132740]OBB37059.1 hypothetical protein A5748_03910 [Nocardia sp. 852002-51244_SCH5132740]
MNTVTNPAQPSIGNYTRLITRRILRATQHSDMSLVDLAKAANMDVHDLAASLCGHRGLYLNETVMLGMALGIGFGELFSTREDQ